MTMPYPFAACVSKFLQRALGTGDTKAAARLCGVDGVSELLEARLWRCLPDIES